MGNCNFRPPLQNRHPSTGHQKFVGDYVGVPKLCAKFGVHTSTGGGASGLFFFSEVPLMEYCIAVSMIRRQRTRLLAFL